MSNFGFQPYSDLLVIERTEVEQKTAGGIFIVEKEEDQEIQYGTVVAAGYGKVLDSSNVAIPLRSDVGDVVAFNPRQLTPFKHEGIQYFLIRESEVKGKLIK